MRSHALTKAVDADIGNRKVSFCQKAWPRRGTPILFAWCLQALFSYTATTSPAEEQKGQNTIHVGDRLGGLT